MGKKLSYTSGDRAAAMTFELDGETFEFAPPKIAGPVLPMMDAEAAGTNGDYRAAMATRTWDWLHEGLGDVQYKKIIDRLQAKDDPLDYPVVAGIANDLLREVAGRPTKRRST